MFLTLTVLAALISGMFVASVASTVTALKRENEDFRAMMERRKALVGLVDRGSILLEMPLEDGRLVTVKLPQTYTISLKAQRALKEIPGVERVVPRRAA